MTRQEREEAVAILSREIDEDLFVRTEYREQIHKALKTAIKALEQQESDDFARWVAEEIFDENWEYNRDAFEELACRKLAKLGIVRANGNEWELVEQPSCDTCEHSDEINGSNCYECVKGIRDRHNPQSCEDVISRQAVIGAFERFIHELGIEDELYNHGEMALSVKNVPPVNPQPCEDAINREDALMCLTGELKETDTIEKIIARFGRRIKKLPPVNPQLKTESISVSEYSYLKT